MSLEERVGSVQKELQALEERLKGQADYKGRYEELVAATENKLNAAQVETEELKRKVGNLEEDVKVLNSQNQQLQDALNHLDQEKGSLERKLHEADASQTALKVLMLPIVRDLIQGELHDIALIALDKATGPIAEKLSAQVMEDLRKGDIPQELAHRVIQVLGTQEIKMVKPLAEFFMEVERGPLSIDPKTARGKVYSLITDGFFDKQQSIPKAITEINNQYPTVKVDRDSVEAEVNYFVEQAILRHVTPDASHHYYALRPEAKGRLHVTEKRG